MVRNKNNPKRIPGIAKTRRSIVPKTGYPTTFSQRLPAIMAVNAVKMTIHIPMLNEDTDPSARPRRKKTKTMVHISTSMPQNVQNNLSFKSISSSIMRKFSRRQGRQMLLEEFYKIY
jgi:hypothetical protein